MHLSSNGKGNRCYGTCSKYLGYSIDRQVVGFRIQASVVSLLIGEKLAQGFRIQTFVVDFFLR